MTTRRLIGITGKKGAGKNSLADVIEQQHEGPVVQLSFAGPLKQCVGIIFGLTPQQMSMQDLKEEVDERWGKTPRELMQLFGTEVGRQIDLNVWVKSLQARANLAWKKDPRTLVVITDVRFENEAEAVRSMRGLLVRIERPIGKQLGLFGGHTSETEMEDIEVELTVCNDCTALETLQPAARWVLDGLISAVFQTRQKRRLVCSEVIPL